MAPTAWLSVMVTPERVTSAPVLRMPPPMVTLPKGPAAVVVSARPSAMVRSAMVTLVLSPLMSKTRLALSPLMVSWFAPRPSMFRL